MMNFVPVDVETANSDIIPLLCIIYVCCRGIPQRSTHHKPSFYWPWV